MSERIIQNTTTEIEQFQKPRLTIGMVGCIASGKTTVSRELGKRWGMEPIEEKHEENPFLEEFYDNLTGSGYNDYSFKSQTHFLISKFNQLKDVDRTKVSIIDPSLPMDFLFANTQYKLGFMNRHEWNLYQNLFYSLSSKAGLIYPDIHIITVADQKDLKERIIKRGRKYELSILEKCPKYLEELTETVYEWAAKKENNSYKFIANTSGDNPDYNLKELVDRVETFICINFGGNSGLELPKMQPPEIFNEVDFFSGAMGDSVRFLR